MDPASGYTGSVHIRRTVHPALVLLLLTLGACGAAPAPAAPSSAARYDGPAGILPATLIGTKENQPKIAWEDAARTDALLRRLALDYISALKDTKIAAIKANDLTEAAAKRAVSCAAGAGAANEEAAWTACVKLPAGMPVIEETKITDALHATIRLRFYSADGKQLGEARTLPVVLTGRGPRLDDPFLE